MARTNSGWSRATRIGAGLLLAVTAAVAGPAQMAAAAPPEAPGNLSVSQPDAATPVLTWGAVAGAARYEVEVDDDPGFGSPYGGRNATVVTVNTAYVPTSVLSAGTNYWRVRALNTGSERSAWSQGSFTAPAVAVPEPISPVGGRALQQPNDPPLLTWRAVPGADSYQVLVDGDRDLVGAQTYTTKHTSLVVPDLLGEGDWFWQVTAIKGNLSSRPSDVASFNVNSMPTPTLRSPINGAQVQDVVLDWDPVPGARSYDVQVSTNRDFTVGDARILDATGVVGTRFSPDVNFNNASYFWRVRAVDVEGNAPDWRNGTYGAFSRTYPYTPGLVYPANSATVGDPMYMQWTPVRHASEYELALSTDPGFPSDSDITQYCRVAGTTYTPGAFAFNKTTGSHSLNRRNETCRVTTAGKRYYWKVRALDRPFSAPGNSVPGIQGAYSATRSFVYSPTFYSHLSPSNGETVEVPTLRWRSSANTDYFALEIKDARGDRVVGVDTRATSYTPHGRNRLKPEDGPFTWSLRAQTASGGTSLVSTGNRFQVTDTVTPGTEADALTPISPTATTPGLTRAPEMTWKPHPDASYYTVRVGQNNAWFGSERGSLLNEATPYPSLTDTDGRLRQPGTYMWQVTAHLDDGRSVTGPRGGFVIQNRTAVRGHRIALDGQGLASGAGCTAASGCTVPTTPTLQWERDPNAAYYEVYLSRDPNFTNLLEADASLQATTNTMYTPTLANRASTLADRTAGQDNLGDAYYWHVRPCWAQGSCASSPISTSGMVQHTFKKESPRPQGLTSSSPAGTEITFAWNDYRTDNHNFVWQQTGERSNQSAMQYRIQVDDDASFGSPIDTRVVDQTTYTAPGLLYPEGRLFWRVQAVDSAGNGLAWSEVKSFTKASPQVSVISPTSSQTAADSTVFRWQAQNFAGTYDVELYRNNDRTFSSANRIFAKNGLKTTAYAHEAPLEPSNLPYVWRVRRTDAKGNKGPWSNPIPFQVAAAAPAITSPANNGTQPANAPMVSWRPVAGAANYSVTVRPSAGSGTTETAITPASAFAATKRFPTGTYVAVVSARNAAGGTIGTSSVTFTVNSRLTATTPPRIEAPSGANIGKTLTSVAPVWNQPGVTNAYQWLRNDQAIRGATATTYTMTSADLGQRIQLRVTGTKPNFDTGSSLSNTIGGVVADGLTPTTLPTIIGKARVGNTLRVRKGSWSQSGVEETYQWLRNGRPIRRATRTQYRLVNADAGRRIRVRVTATKAGYGDGTAMTAIKRIPKLRSTTAITLRVAKIKPSARARMGITVKIPGVTRPTGKIRILRGKRIVRTVTLRARAKGSINVRLPRLPRGKHKMRARYLGNRMARPSNSTVLRLTVTRT